CRHPLPASLGLRPSCATSPIKGEVGAGVWGGCPPFAHSAHGLLPEGEKNGPTSVSVQRLLFLSPSGRGWIGRSPRRVRGVGGRVPNQAGAWEHPLLASLGLPAKLRYLPRQGGGGAVRGV